MLLPALRNAKEQGRRAACASNLRRWGLALHNYYLGYDSRLPDSVHLGGGEPFPSMCTISNNARGEISAEGMGRYLPGVNFATKSIGQIWFCPSNLVPDWNTGLVVFDWSVWDAFNMQYSHFGHVDKCMVWANTVAQGQLTQGDLESSKVRMADQLFYAVGSAAWMYNHGRNGAANPWTGSYASGVYDPGPARLTGADVLRGDGSVAWKPDSQYDKARLQSFDPSLPWVYGFGVPRYTY